MCGIAGIVAPDARRHAAALDRMVDALRHRGPDGRGTHIVADCALGHTRLSIIDHDGGAQPMLAPDGQTAVVFNGEIYGYKSLRERLARDYSFRSSSDTEVLLALYEQHGGAMLDKLPGMFAFGIWDERRKALFCARDRFGEKPFFYAVAPDGSFVFASEIKAILASGFIEPELDPDSVAHYLRYLYVHPHDTIYRNIQTLPPAHRLIYSDGRVDIAPYWTLPASNGPIDIDEAADRFRTLLARAVSNQLIADVPVGAFLSGGLDSSTIVALAAAERGRCRTFSFGFAPAIDERPFARGMAERCGTEHLELSHEGLDVAAALTRMAEVYDEPFGDSSNIPTYLLCQQARRHVTVALTGEGADELLGGYTFWYRSLFEMDEAASRHAAAVGAARVAGAICRRTGMTPPEWVGRLNRGALLARAYEDPGAAHAARSAQFSAAEIAALLPDSDVAWAASRPAARTLDEVLRGDLTTYLPGDILVKADRASMAHGFELRAPFLDWEFASFCLSLPIDLKVTAHTDRLILRRAFADAWTPAVQSRGKQGFGAPVADWLQRPEVRAITHDVLDNPRSVVFDHVSKAAADRARASGDAERTWPLLVLAVWCEQVAAKVRAPQFT